FEALVRHGYRMRTTMMVHAKALYRDLAARDKSVSVPKEAAWNVPEGKNPWKSSAPFTPEEGEALLKDGIARHPLFDFTPVAFSDDLRPATALKLPDGPTGTFGLYSRGQRTYFTWVAEAPATLSLRVKGGLVYTNRGDVKLTLTPVDDVEGKPAAQASVAA